MSPFLDALARNGVPGIIAALALYAVFLLYKQIRAGSEQQITELKEVHARELARLEQVHARELAARDDAHGKEIARVDAAWKAEVERSNRFEGELSEMNKLVKTEYAGALVRATDATREFLDRERRR